MSKIYVTNNTGSLQTLNNADDDKVKVYNSLEDVDTSVLEEGEIIAVKDEAIDTSDIADTIVDNATAEINNLIANSGVPAGTIMSIKSNATLNGWLPCDGSTFDRTEYPFLYAALGNSNVLPISYNWGSLPEKPQVAIQNRSDYVPVGWTYGGTNPTWIPTIQEFTADGYLCIHTDDYCYLWIQDSDSTIHGYTVGDRDNVGNDVWIPIKKGGKIYGLNRNGTSTPAPSTEIANYDYTKIAIYYYTEYNYIRALSGVETVEESQSVVNAIAQAESDLEQVVTDTADAIVATAINTKLADKTTLVEMANTYTNIPANTTLLDSILNYEEVWFYARRSASATSEFFPVMIFTHEQVESFVANTGTYSFIIPGYTECRQVKFNATGDTITAVNGSGCIYKIVGYMKRV